MEQDKELQLILDDLKSWAGYSCLPPRLKKMYPALAQRQRDDEHGVAARLKAIQSVLADEKLGAMIDLGGNSGYFCLSLIDAGMAASATVYDVVGGALAAGRQMAELLGIGEKICFVEQSVDLAFVQNLPNVDTFLCLNFLHNAGTLFDVERVHEEGWARYVQQWLRLLREKGRFAIISLGFDPENPVHWDEPLESRARCFARFAEDAGWSIRYYANVRELERRGVDAASGRYTTPSHGNLDAALKAAIKTGNTPLLRPLKDALKRGLRRAQVLPKVRNVTGSQKFYHLYILEIP